MLEHLRIPCAGPRAHIRIISPAMQYLASAPARAHRAERALTDLGFTFSYGDRALLTSDDGTTAGSGKERAADFMDAFQDPEVEVVLSADAGFGTRDLLEFIDPDTIATSPKPFVGYCDNVFLHLFLAASAGLSSLYGCTFMKHFGEAGGPFPETRDYFTRALGGSNPLIYGPVPSRVGKPRNWYVAEDDCLPRERDVEGGWDWVRPGTAQGILVGGEITLIPDLVRRFGLSLRSVVLFWDISHHGLPIRPLFQDMCERTDMVDLAGMIIGAHPTIAPARWAATMADLVDEFLPDASYPIVVNSDLSHLSPSWIVPYGEEVHLDSGNWIVFPRGHTLSLIVPPQPGQAQLAVSSAQPAA